VDEGVRCLTADKARCLENCWKTSILRGRSFGFVVGMILPLGRSLRCCLLCGGVGLLERERERVSLEKDLLQDRRFLETLFFLQGNGCWLGCDPMSPIPVRTLKRGWEVFAKIRAMNLIQTILSFLCFFYWIGRHTYTV